MDSPKKILTIDGGGLRGVAADPIIEQTENAVALSSVTAFLQHKSTRRNSRGWPSFAASTR